MDEDLANNLQEQLSKLERIALISGMTEAADWIRENSKHASVFVEDANGHPEKMLLWVAKEKGLESIKCVMCGRDATEIDSLHPYHQEYDRCAACVND